MSAQRRFFVRWRGNGEETGSSETTAPVSGLKRSEMSPLSPIRAAVWATKGVKTAR